MSARRAFEEKVVEAVLRAAMDSEALYTMLLGAPAICRFTWRPDFALGDELQRLEILEQASHETTSKWLADLLRREKFAPPTAQLPMQLPFSDQGPQPFIFRLDTAFSNVAARLPAWFTKEEQHANTFQLYCMNLLALHEAGVDLRFPQFFSAVADRWGQVAHHVYSSFELHRQVPTTARPYDYVLEVVKQVGAASTSTPGAARGTMQPVPIFWTPDRLNRIICVPETAPILSVSLPPGPNDNSGSMHPCPPAPAVVLSTPTACSGSASLGWVHADQQQPLSSDELQLVLDRAAVLRTYLALLPAYQGKLRHMLLDWSTASGLSELVSHAVQKARSACYSLLPGQAKLQREFKDLLAPNQTNSPSSALLLRRLLSSRRQARTPEERKRYDDQIHNLWLDCMYHYDRIWTDQHFSRTKDLTAALAVLEEPGLPVGMVAIKALRLVQARQTNSAANRCIENALRMPETVLLELLRYPAEREEFVTQLSAPVVEDNADDDASWAGQAYLAHFVTRAKKLQSEAGKHLSEVLQAYLADEQPQIATSASAPLIVLDAQGLAMWPLQSSP